MLQAQRSVLCTEAFAEYNILPDPVVILSSIRLARCKAKRQRFMTQVEQHVTFVSANCQGNSNILTLSPARMRKLSITCSAVSVSVDSRVMKSRKASKCTQPELLGSTIARIRWKSMSPCLSFPIEYPSDTRQDLNSSGANLPVLFLSKWLKLLRNSFSCSWVIP